MASSNENNFEMESNHDIDIAKYASYRRKEIDLLNNESFLSKENKTKSLFQMLPRHMRRRTMGYIRKRLPHRIRKVAIIKPPSKINKRPSRKYRRRPSNLLKEYERRKRVSDNKMWLETHIWHAKRFHMSDSLYGYRLAVHDNCKGKRAVFKCLKQHCCIHDESYYVCHELIGKQEELIQGLAKLCSPQTGLTFAAKICLNGQCEGRTILYEAEKYPFNCIGQCRFIWKAETDLASDKLRSLWIWSHPSIYKQVQNEFIKVFELKLDENNEINQNESTNLNEANEDSPLAKKRKIIEKNDSNEPEISNTNKKIANDFVPFSWSNAKNIKLRCLKDKFIRFKLLGPLSTTILGNVLKTVDLDNAQKNEFSNNNEFYKKQSEVWDKIKFSVKNPNEIVSASVIGLLVKDPRLAMPKKKSFNQVKEQNNNIDSYSRTSLTQEVFQEIRKSVLSNSTLWYENVIEELNKNKKSTHEINKIRSNYLIPGTELTQIENHSKIPVLLIQNTLNNNFSSLKNGSFYSGWDLIIPNTWGMSFWTTLIHYGARAIGQNEMNYLLFESGNFQFPNEFYDTNASLIENTKLKHDAYKKHVSRPPSKRVNYLKLGFFSPFYLPWSGLLKLKFNNFDSIEDPKFYILRNKQLLLKLSNALFCKNKQIKHNLIFEENEMKILSQSYIGIRLTSIGKGTIDQFSLLFDLVKNEKPSNQELENSSLIVNKLLSEYRSDFIENLKNQTDNSKETKINLNKLLRNKFNKNDMLIDEKFFVNYHQELLDSESHILPIGFVCTNGFSLINGKCSANGFILTKCIIDLINNTNVSDKSLISYKIPNANIYRTAKINQFFI